MLRAGSGRLFHEAVPDPRAGFPGAGCPCPHPLAPHTAPGPGGAPGTASAAGAAQGPRTARPRSSPDRQQTSGTGAPRLPRPLPRAGRDRAGRKRRRLRRHSELSGSPCPPPCHHLLGGAERPGSPPFTSPWRPGPAPATHPGRGAAGEGRRGGCRQRRGASGCSRAPETSWRGPLSRTARGGGEGQDRKSVV